MTFDSYDITRVIFLKAVAIIYICGFANVVNQYIGLLGEKGLLPIKYFIRAVPWKNSPSLFYLNFEDKTLKIAGWIGLVLAIAALLGITEKFGYVGHFVSWGILWVLYLSFVNVGQVFYGFGWESLLLETGFTAFFFPPDDIATPLVLIWIVRWCLFRVMFGAGLIKLRGDKCWWDLSCLMYHYETQPMPNPLSWYFHRFPKIVHKGGVLFNHFVELVVPFGVLVPGIIGFVSGFLTFLFQFILILSGNLSWLNYITIVLCIPCFSDSFWISVFGMEKVSVDEPGWLYLGIVYAFGLFVAYRSWEPVKNIFSKKQVMNTSYDCLHLVNTYGAFGSVTKRRFEIIIEGTHDENPTNLKTSWKEYEFKGKPGNLGSCPPVIAPYHMRLDWLMWFAAMGNYQHYPWTVHLLKKLLEGEPEVLKLLKYNPFEDELPRWVRAELFVYNFTESGSKDWWVRKYVGAYIPAVQAGDQRLTSYCKAHGWCESTPSPEEVKGAADHKGGDGGAKKQV